MKEIRYYIHTNGKEPLTIWLNSLDIQIRKRIIKRLARIEENDNFGDFKKLDEEISELRFDFGSGYRIYYSELEDIIILLLNGGDKKSQSKDIKKAKEYLQIWRNNNENL